MTISEELQLEKFKIEHPHPEDFAVFCWQSTRDVSIGWVVYRLILWLYFFSTILFVCVWWCINEDRKDMGKFLLFFGFWVYAVQTDAYFWGFVLAVYDYAKQREGDSKDRPAFFYKCYWFVYSAMLPLTITSTASFWLGIYDKRLFPMNAMNVILHIPNAVLALVDFCLIAFPIRFLHFYMPDIVLVLYITVTLIYEFAGGRGVADLRPIYEYLDWKEELYRTAVWVIVFCILAMVDFFLFAFASMMKMSLRKKYFVSD